KPNNERTRELRRQRSPYPPSYVRFRTRCRIAPFFFVRVRSTSRRVRSQGLPACVANPRPHPSAAQHRLRAATEPRATGSPRIGVEDGREFRGCLQALPIARQGDLPAKRRTPFRILTAHLRRSR